MKSKDVLTKILNDYGIFIYNYVIKSGSNKGQFYLQSTAIKLFSVAKTQLENLCDLEISSKKYTEMTSGLKSAISNRAFRMGFAMEKTKETATEDSMKGMAILCIWSNTKIGVSLWFFILSMVYFVGRGMEVALAQMKDFSSQRMNEWGRNGTLSILVWIEQRHTSMHKA